jgi:DNA-binding transcriptional regulator WhiA
MKEANYLYIDERDVRRFKEFKLTFFEDKVLISFKQCPNNITINLPFELNEDIASLAGMMGDGSLIKDLRRIYFSQKKDLKKNYQFKELIEKLFKPNNKIFIRKGHNAYDTYTNSTVFVHFLYKILNFTKSDESMRVPKWVFKSPDSVKRAYLREAYAMEGTIPKSLYEIRFITKDQDYVLDLQKLLLSLGINSFVKERIGGTYNTIQYRLSVYRKENFREFLKIGFTAPLHLERFNAICRKYDLNKEKLFK